MYSNIESVQIVIALLKKFRIKDIVIAPGGSDIPLIHSIETDEFFKCYSIVDERSAIYFALGVAQQKNKRVACICTSGTAVCNFFPGITEAYYQNVPLIAITADKNPYFQGQLETQKIEQSGIFGDKVKCSVTLPIIRTKDDWWLCERLVNEALLESDHHGNGPVHINIPIVGSTAIYDCKNLPKVRKIERVSLENEILWKKYRNKLKEKKRVLIIIGQNVMFNQDDIKYLNNFFEKYNCVYAVEHLSNVNCEGRIFTYPLTEMLSNFCGKHIFDELEPEVIISLGNNLSAYDLKKRLRERYENMEHWLISESGNIRDEYKCLTTIFECKPMQFFEKFASNFEELPKVNQHEYYEQWKRYVDCVDLSELEFSSLYIAQKLAELIPEKSILHTAILNSTRVMQFFPLKENVRSYSNVGALGIDGCLSVFLGQAAATEELAFLLIGDLSFFYDMNAAGIREVGKNVRILMLNNGGGEEFHFFMGKQNIPTINEYISAAHQKNAKGWIVSLGYQYYSVQSKQDFEKIVDILAEKSDKPIFVEVFMDMEKDAKYLRACYNKYNEKLLPKYINAAKNLVKKLPETQIKRLQKICKF